MVLLRTFSTEQEAESAQDELRASGIQSLLFSEDASATVGRGSPRGVHLAVHQRDQVIAEAVLKAVMKAE